MKQNCIICDIINKKRTSFIVYEDDFFISFLDIKPLFIGHCLIAPKDHFPTIYDLPKKTGNHLLEVTQKIGKAVRVSMNAEGTFIAINNNVSQSIDHMHIHLIPRKKGDKLKGFFWPRVKYENEKQMQEVQLIIKKEIENQS